ncbi:alpha-(1,3)-fucosyltransferase C-like [Pollicipes pollicipes]|uniref:alpha-(1,3)-fucosyltransferase C-like n=1 Tax=Pollicipes pollicipes TaxID=41117 RepID=UPI0018855ADB|nr:alpha-(1,3)-fucosyltransferase C-like [Pollicipes pollicipes]
MVGRPRLVRPARLLLGFSLGALLTVLVVWSRDQWLAPAAGGQARPGPARGEHPPRTRAPRTVLYWNTFYDAADFYVGFGDKPFRGCPYSNCITTNNRSLSSRADAVVVHMLNPVDPLPRPRPPHQRFVFFLKEPPTLSYLPYAPYRDVFNLTMTYRLDSDVVNGYYQLLPGPERTPLPPLETRSRAVAWLVSHCDTTSGRELYVDLLEEFLPVDIYGACGPNRCPTGAHQNREECYRLVAQHYYFYLSFENAQCSDYVTEKLALALQYGMVPVVLGPSRANYERVAPPGSFLHIDDFAGPQQLAEHLNYLISNSTAYRELFRWREHFHVAGSAGWCELCRYLHEPHAPQYYADIGQWWIAEGRCSIQPVVPEPNYLS